MIDEFDPDNNYVDRDSLHEDSDDGSFDPNIEILVDFPWTPKWIWLPRIFTLNYLRPIPEDTILESKVLHNVPIIWLLLRKINCMAGIVFLHKLPKNQFHKSVQERYKEDPFEYQSFAKNLLNFSNHLLDKDKE